MKWLLAVSLLGFSAVSYAKEARYYKSDTRSEWVRGKSGKPGYMRNVPVTREWVKHEAARYPHTPHYFHNGRRPSNEHATGRQYINGKWLDRDQINKSGREKSVHFKDSSGKAWVRVPNAKGGYNYRSPQAARRETSQRQSERLFGKPLNPGNYTPGRRR